MHNTDYSNVDPDNFAEEDLDSAITMVKRNIGHNFRDVIKHSKSLFQNLWRLFKGYKRKAFNITEEEL